jgi:hypothetical protein
MAFLLEMAVARDYIISLSRSMALAPVLQRGILYEKVLVDHETRIVHRAVFVLLVSTTCHY